MKLSVSSVIPQNPVFLWLWITLLVWWSGLAGRDFFLVPALIFVGIYTYQIRNNQPSIITTKWTNSSYAKRWLISLFLVHVVLNLTITILKYYSFRWNVWDVGSYSTCFTTFRRGVFTHPTWALTIGASTSLLRCHHWLYSIYGFQALTGLLWQKQLPI